MEGCGENGLIIISAGTHKNIIRTLCPLVITDQQLQKGLDIMEQEIQKSSKNLVV
jgi:4-aminobutyrate aminotransferase/(S)-3-amino-2-methylpropionate transaminase